MVAAAGVEAAAEVIGAGSTVCGLGALIRMAISLVHVQYFRQN